jgi:hypothetical protein
MIAYGWTYKPDLNKKKLRCLMFYTRIDITIFKYKKYVDRTKTMPSFIIKVYLQIKLAIDHLDGKYINYFTIPFNNTH